LGKDDEMKKFSKHTRLDNIQKMQTEKFDLLIIGGGITGAGVARDAAGRGLKVALIEASDFASGTSSRSSKLIHGGIRYLENKEFHLVFEALSERTKLFEIAPHLVHPLRFMIPLYKSSRVGMFLMGLGMILYDVLALFQAPQLHEKLNAEESKNRMPILKDKDLLGSYVYSDAYMDDDRLVHETLRSANELGAVISNYLKAESSVFHPESGQISAIKVSDQLTGHKFEIQTHHIVSSVGPWTDLVGHKLVQDWKNILRPTKGIHLTFSKDRIPLSSAVVMAAEKGSRIIFAIPRHEMVIVGTTDTDFKGNPRDAKVTPEDVRYLLEVSNSYFPGADLKASDIISSYVGVRPLVKDESDNEGKTSREHVIKHDECGITFVAGGKYTTYRLMSEQIVDQCLKFFPFEKIASLQNCQTSKSLNKYTTVDEFENAVQFANSDLEKKLAIRYGAEAKLILEKFGYTSDIWEIEAYQAISTTMCLNLTDFYTRRVPFILSEADHGISKLNQIAKIFQSEFSLTEAEIEKQKNDLINYIENELDWRKDFN
jgi:glycerol-3-phosphate dehydrogenase